MKRIDKVQREIADLQKAYFLRALVFVLIILGFGIIIALIFKNAGDWRYAIIAVIGGGGIGSSYLTIFRSMKQSGPLQNLQKLHEKLSLELPPVNANVILRPRSEDDYEELFEGFTESDFIGYNAPWWIENRSDRVYEKGLQVHLEWYEKGVTSKSLFYDRGSYERAVKFFKDLEERAMQKGISLAGKAELQYLPAESIPTYTFFAGYRSGIPRCILYPSATLKNGLPDAVVVVDGDENLLAIMSDHFDKHWDIAQKSTNSDFWKPRSTSQLRGNI
ncbi:MAG: hypothetical protein AMJ73_04550 [candidate division Zixibacteria bacterium SM1_73]|nr:MAG: hypothetical protein AMJ73_04550 [candidate division Zixibacteria bacterium SM1_73]